MGASVARQKYNRGSRYANPMPAHNEGGQSSQPLHVTGTALVRFTLAKPGPGQMERLKQHVREVAQRINADHGGGFEDSSTLVRWEVDADGATVANGGWNSGPNRQDAALASVIDNLNLVFPPESRSSSHQLIVDRMTAELAELAEAGNAADPEAARREIFEREARKMREHIQRLEGRDPDAE